MGRRFSSPQSCFREFLGAVLGGFRRGLRLDGDDRARLCQKRRATDEPQLRITEERDGRNRAPEAARRRDAGGQMDAGAPPRLRRHGRGSTLRPQDRPARPRSRSCTPRSPRTRRSPAASSRRRTRSIGSATLARSRSSTSTSPRRGAFLVMEPVDGEPLSDLVEASKVDVPPDAPSHGRAARRPRRRCTGTASSTATSSRENLFVLRDGRLKVLDFGIAQMRQGAPKTSTPPSG